MNCQNHPDVAAIAYCRTCGKPVCGECRREASGTVYCAEHAPAAAPPPFTAPPPYSAPPTTAAPPYAPLVAPSPYVRADIHPGLAFALGWIPGVGAIYNGQYAKGLIHAIVWGVLMSIANSEAIRDMQPIFIILVIAWMAYMVFDATQKRRRRWIPRAPAAPELRGRASVSRSARWCGCCWGGVAAPASTSSRPIFGRCVHLADPGA